MRSRVFAKCILVCLFAGGCNEQAGDAPIKLKAMDQDNTWTSDALQRGDADAIREKVLEDPGYIHERDFLGNTPLLSTIATGDLDLVRFLLEHGSNPNVEVDDGYTCLLSAVESDFEHSAAIVAELINAGADIHVAGTNGWTPLHMASARGKVEIARLLIKAGAAVNRRKEIDASETPLMEAAEMGHPEIVSLLLEHGADPSMRDSMQNRTPLEIAVEAAKGPDPKVVNQLRKMDFQPDLDEVFTGMELPPDELEKIREMIGEIDMVQSYIDGANDRMKHGNHAEVIRILSGLSD